MHTNLLNRNREFDGCVCKKWGRKKRKKKVAFFNSNLANNFGNLTRMFDSNISNGTTNCLDPPITNKA